MLEISLKKDLEGFEIFKNFLLEDRISFLKGFRKECDVMSLVLLDRDIVFERFPSFEENILTFKDNLPWFKLYYPPTLSSREMGRYGKPILFPKGELVVTHFRSFRGESLAKRDWIINEVPYALINTILKLTGYEEYKNVQLEGHTVLYKGKKILGEETFYNSSSVLFDCQIHLNWTQNCQDIYNKYCSKFKSIYDKGSLLQLLNVPEDQFLKIFIEELKSIEYFIDIIK